MTTFELLAQKNLESRKHADAFRRTFGMSLANFYNPVTGFDVVKFDDWLKTPNGKSTKQFLTKKYGKPACVLVERLISI